jgi:hypothetical protein
MQEATYFPIWGDRFSILSFFSDLKNHSKNKKILGIVDR